MEFYYKVEIFLLLLPLYYFITYIQTDSCILTFYSLPYIFFTPITYFIAQIIPDLARKSPFSWFLCPFNTPLPLLEHFLTSWIAKWFGSSCTSPTPTLKSVIFQKKLCFFLLENDVHFWIRAQPGGAHIFSKASLQSYFGHMTTQSCQRAWHIFR